MKKTVKILGTIFISSILLSSCGTIVGGSKYNAHVVVANNPNAKIYYKNELQGTGTATIKVKRNDANKFAIVLKDNNCQDETKEFNSSVIRGWAVAGTILGWTGLVGGIPLPWGLAVDLATGALLKPNVAEKGVTKEDYKNFKYTLNYGGCLTPTKQETKIENKSGYSNTVYLKNGSVIKGNVIEQIQGVQIKLQTNDGNIFVYKTNEVEKITADENSSNSDVVYLKNGSVIRGIIIEQLPNVQIKMKTKDGNIFVYKTEEIEKITK